ncbi:MAG: hypothetical protein KIT31_11990, partial [Deltaproteobacteria bacterium]|nr:hypothetical protein [Deltaproteobacteria bacterium]
MTAAWEDALDPALVARLAWPLRRPQVPSPWPRGLALVRRIFDGVDALLGKLPLLARFPGLERALAVPETPIVHPHAAGERAPTPVAVVSAAVPAVVPAIVPARVQVPPASSPPITVAPPSIPTATETVVQVVERVHTAVGSPEVLPEIAAPRRSRVSRVGAPIAAPVRPSSPATPTTPSEPVQPARAEPAARSPASVAAIDAQPQREATVVVVPPVVSPSRPAGSTPSTATARARDAAAASSPTRDAAAAPTRTTPAAASPARDAPAT